MHIDFKCSGGFANLQLEYHVNTDNLPQDTAEELFRLVKSSGFFDIQENKVITRSKGSPDVFYYHLSVHEGKKKKSLSFNDVTAPTALRPLLTYLQNLAFDQKGKK